MPISNTPADGRRKFLRRLAALAGVLCLAGVLSVVAIKGCGESAVPTRTLHPKRLPPNPNVAREKKQGAEVDSGKK